MGRLERLGVGRSGWLVLCGEARWVDVLYRPQCVVMNDGAYFLFRRGVLDSDVLYDVWRLVDDVADEDADVARYWFVDGQYRWLDASSLLSLRYVPRSRWDSPLELVVMCADRLFGYRHVRSRAGVRLWLKNLHAGIDWGLFYGHLWRLSDHVHSGCGVSKAASHVSV